MWQKSINGFDAHFSVVEYSVACIFPFHFFAPQRYVPIRFGIKNPLRSKGTAQDAISNLHKQLDKVVFFL